MTALPAMQAITEAPPAPYLSLEQAAAAMNRSHNQIQRLCRERWSKQGHARKENGRWIVHPDADERLQSPSLRRENCKRRDREQMAAMFYERTRRVDLETAERRREIVQRFDDFQASGKTDRVFAQFKATMLAEGLVPAPGIQNLCSATLYKWRKDYREGGIRALVPRWTECGRKPHAIGDEAWNHFEMLVLGCGSMSIAEAYTLTLGLIERKHKNQSGWEWPGLKTIERRARDVFVRRRGGKRGYTLRPGRYATT